MALWIVVTAVINVRERLHQQSLGSLPLAYLGMLAAHLGVAVFIIGVTMVKGYETEHDLRMSPGDTATVGGYTFRFDGITDVAGPNYQAARGRFVVIQNGKEVAMLEPEKRMYTVQSMPMTEAAIQPGVVRDLYVSLGEPVGTSAWAVRIYIKPFVQWIWAGCLLMAFGGILAMSDRRYRRREKTVTVPAAAKAMA
jgi:cytochrome c-type biogenesis protein CcmF